MTNDKIYVIRNPLIIAERIQPSFSQFTLQYEGVSFPIFVNDTAAEILRLCDGTKRIDDICMVLSSKYNEPVSEVEEKLLDFWKMAEEYRHIQFASEPSLHSQKIAIYGSHEYWTPDLLSVEITHKCPLRCKHCFLSAGSGESMEMSTWKTIAKSIFAMHIPQVQLTGGEPLLHPEFFNMLDDLLKNDVTVHVFTSGVVWSDELFDKFKSYTERKKKILFQVSLDGLAEYHDAFRGVRGSFERAIIFINSMVNLGYKTTVGISITSQTFSELEALCKLCKEIGVSVVRMGGISNRGRAKENGLGSKNDELIKISNIRFRIAEQLECDSFKVLLNEEANPEVTKYMINCGLGQTSLKIGPNGMVFPCMMSSTAYANIKSNSLMEIQKKYSSLFEKIKAPSVQECAGCENQAICDGCIVEGCAHSYCACKWIKNNIEILKILL